MLSTPPRLAWRGVSGQVPLPPAVYTNSPPKGCVEHGHAPISAIAFWVHPSSLTRYLRILFPPLPHGILSLLWATRPGRKRKTRAALTALFLPIFLPCLATWVGSVSLALRAPPRPPRSSSCRPRDVDLLFDVDFPRGRSRPCRLCSAFRSEAVRWGMVRVRSPTAGTDTFSPPFALSGWRPTVPIVLAPPVYQGFVFPHFASDPLFSGRICSGAGPGVICILEILNIVAHWCREPMAPQWTPVCLTRPLPSHFGPGISTQGCFSLEFLVKWAFARFLRIYASAIFLAFRGSSFSFGRDFWPIVFCSPQSWLLFQF